jgi:hypothetical protein
MKKHLLILFCLFVASCSTTIKDFDKYQKSPLLRTEFAPDPNSIYKPVPTTIILPFKNGDENSKSISANSIAENEVANILVSNKLVTLQDRKNLKTLNDEIKLSEIQNSKSAELRAVDFAIEGEVSSVAFSSQYQDARYNDDGSLFRPERYIYTASVRGSITVYELPSLRVVDTIPFTGQDYSYEEVKDSGISYKSFKLSNKNNAKQFDANLARRTLDLAIRQNAYRLKSVFAKTGYVVEKRTLGNKAIFLISLGSNDGIGQETKVQIIQKYQDLNALTGKTETLERAIARGTVADKTEGTKTWIVLDDEKMATSIKLGDVVKIVYTK